MIRAPRTYRWLLRLHPRTFRERAGEEAERVAAEVMAAARQSGRIAMVAAWLGLVRDAAGALPGAWIGAMTRARAAHPGPGGNLPEVLWLELRHAARRLRRSPLYALASVITLALGLGATTAVLAVVDAALLEPLPWTDADALLVVSGSRNGEELSVAYPDLRDWRERVRSVEDVAGFAGATLNLTGAGEAARVRGQVVTSNLFDLLRVAPAQGRAFRAEEDLPGARSIILSHAMWETRFGADPQILGRAITLNDEPFTVIGVMPPGFAFPSGIVYGAAEFWLPAGYRAQMWETRESHMGIIALARMSDGATLEGVRRDFEAVAAQLRAEHPVSNANEGVIVTTALDALVGSLRPVLLVLLGAVAFVLLIACANVANLALVRAAARSRETAVRTALGAGRGRLVMGVVAESLLLCAAGSVAGIFLARVLLRVCAALFTDLPRLASVPVDLRVAGAVLLLGLLTALGFGLLAGARGAGHALAAAGSGMRVSSARLRGAFVVAQVALALMLLIGAGVLVRSFLRMQSADGGIRPEGVIVFTIRLPEARYGEEERVVFYERLLAELEALPGVSGASGISTLPFSGAGSQSGFRPLSDPAHEEVRTDVNGVLPGWFDVMGIELLSGRTFDERDRAGAPWAVVVDETLARRFWPGEQALGQRVRGWGLPDAEVVGIVRHVKNYGVNADSRQELYVAHAQRPYDVMTIAVRAADPGGLAAPIRDIVHRFDPDLPVDNLRPMRDVVEATVATPRLAAVLAALFAFMATLLAAVGIYGVIAYGVNLRAQEIGTRVALGATSARVLVMVIGGALRLALLGIALGWLGAFLLSRVLESLVFGVSARDAASFIALPVVLLAVAALAGLMPGLRAMRISPMRAVS